ncbi:hypothetical protein [Streptosporangium sp. NPDC048865]|uniref:hypothetical protein n=1 Tax=Streptosporangium sp. NPDC048865 TaxID=3155766 RepID=UPI00344AD2F4
MSGLEIVFAVLSGLLVNECCEIAPWAARRLVRWSARLRYRDAEQAEVRAEELSAFINDRPGKLFKLVTALGFVMSAMGSHGKREAERTVIRGVGTRMFRDMDEFAYGVGWTTTGSGLRRSYRDPRFDDPMPTNRFGH